MTESAKDALITESSPAEKVALRRLRHRRSKLVRSLGMVSIVSLLMVAISVNERDRQLGKRCRQSLMRYSELIKRSLPGPIPPNLLELRDEPEILVPAHYNYISEHVLSSLVSKQPLAICYCKAPHRLLWGDDGRNVLTLTEGRFRVEWMTESVFQARRAALGAAVDPEPAPQDPDGP